jgi:hypothetical protein
VAGHWPGGADAFISLAISAFAVSRDRSGIHRFRVLLFNDPSPVENTVWVYSVDFIGRYLANACRTAALSSASHASPKRHWRTI